MLKGANIYFRDVIVIDDKSSVGILTNDKIEIPKNFKPPERSDKDDRIFNKILTSVKELYNKPVMLVETDSTHYGYVNGNYSYYDSTFIRTNAKTFTSDYMKPVMLDHMGFSNNVIGRVIAAVPVLYDLKQEQRDSINIPNGHIKTFTVISDTEAIEKIMDGRYVTVSISGYSRSEVTCSICGRVTSSTECTHRVGTYYNEDGEEVEKKTTKSRLAYRKFGKIEYAELSFVAFPADTLALNKRFEMTSDSAENLQDAISMIKNKTGAFDIPHIEGIQDSKSALIFGKDGNEKGSLLYFTDQLHSILKPTDDTKVKENMDKLFTDSGFRCIGDICKIADDVGTNNDTQTVSVPPKLPETSLSDDNGDSDQNDIEKPRANSDEPIDDGDANTEEEDTYMQERFAKLSILASLLEQNAIDRDEAQQELLICGIVFSNEKPPSVKEMIEIIDKELDRTAETDAKLTTKKRKALKASTFCGPNRSWPVPDCEHVRVARAYLSNSRVTKKYSSAQLAKIRACVNRKAKALGCPSSKKKKDNAQPISKENQMKDLAFNTVDELLASQPVQKALDETITERDQTIDMLTSRLKAVTIDRIIELSIKMDKSLVSNLQSAKSEDIEKERKSVCDKLSGRTLDSLEDTYADLLFESGSGVSNSDSEDPSDTDLSDAQNRSLSDDAIPTDNKSDNKPKDKGTDPKSKEPNPGDAAGDSVDDINNPNANPDGGNSDDSAGTQSDGNSGISRSGVRSL